MGLWADRHAPLGGATRRCVALSTHNNSTTDSQPSRSPPGNQQRPGRLQARFTCASSSSGDGVAGLEASKAALAQARQGPYLLAALALLHFIVSATCVFHTIALTCLWC